MALHEESLAIRKETLGERHADVAESLNGMALVLADLGQHDRAMALYEESLAIKKETLGDRHPAVAISLNNMAGLLEDLGQNDRAMALSEESLAILKDTLGERHPAVATSLNNMASLLADLGQGCSIQYTPGIHVHYQGAIHRVYPWPVWGIQWVYSGYTVGIQGMLLIIMDLGMLLSVFF